MAVKKIAAVVLFFVLPFVLAAEGDFKIKFKPPIPLSNPAEINPGCESCEWEISAFKTNESLKRRIKAMHLGGKYRLEVSNSDKTQTQVIIFDNAELYILNPFFKTAALYYLAEPDNLMFLEDIFPGVGIKKKDRTVKGREKIEGRECDVITYRILKRGTNMFVWGTATEWLDRKTGRTIKIESLTDLAQMPHNGKMIAAEPVKQVYLAGKTKKKFFMDGRLFRVPQGYSIVDMKKQYEQALEKQKGIKPRGGYDVRKITINPSKEKK